MDYPGDRCLVGTKIKNDSSIAVKLNRFNAQRISGSADIKFDYVELDTTDEILDSGDICDYEFVIYWDSSSKNQNVSDVRLEIELDYEQYVKKSNVTPAHGHGELKNVRLNYVDKDGNKLAESFEGDFLEGSTYAIDLPSFDGYKAMNDVAKGEVTGDIERDIVYYRESINLQFQRTGVDSYSVVGIGGCTDTNIVIPEFYNGIKVTAIGQNAFKNNKKIKSVTISKYIRVTNDNCFSGCSNLEKIIIYSEDLNIEGENFLPCESLKEFIVNEGNRSYKTVDGVLYSLDGTKLIRYPQAKEDKEFVVPETVTEICTRGIDQNQYLEKIVVPENVKTVGDYVVALSPKLKTLIINSETINGLAAFCENYYITELRIGNNVKEMKGTSGILRKTGQKNTTSITIIYDGTKAEWNNIPKDGNWRQNSKITAVQCTDGIIKF